MKLSSVPEPTTQVGSPSLEVLVSTMNRHNMSFLERLGLVSAAVVVNQNGTRSNNRIDVTGSHVRVVCSDAVGLSRSRNLAVAHASADICVLADDDLTYDAEYVDTILSAYEEYPAADIIAFQVERVGAREPKVFRDKGRWETHLSCLKISSVEITFKRRSVLEAGLRFNECLGTGADFYVGEENVFLWDALRAGLRVRYVPRVIAAVDCSSSSWFKGYTESYFNSLGAAYYNMSSLVWPLLCVQYAIRKHRRYGQEMSFHRALGAMMRGVEGYKGACGRGGGCGDES